MAITNETIGVRCSACGQPLKQRWRQWTSYFLCIVMVLLAIYMVVWEVPDFKTGTACINWMQAHKEMVSGVVLGWQLQKTQNLSWNISQPGGPGTSAALSWNLSTS